MPLEADKKEIILMLKQFSELDISTRPYFVDKNDIEFLQLIEVCLQSFPSQELPFLRKCLNSISFMIDQSIVELCKFHLDAYKNDKERFITELIVELAQEKDFEQAVSLIGFSEAFNKFSNELIIDVDVLVEDLNEIGFEFNYNEEEFEISLFDDKKYVNYVKRINYKKDLNELICTFLLGDSLTKLFVDIVSEGVAESELNKFELSQNEFNLFRALFLLSRYKKECVASDLIMAQSIVVQLLCQDNEIYVDINDSQVHREAKYSELSSQGGKARSGKYKQCEEKIEELLKEKSKLFFTYSDLARATHRDLSKWKEEKVDNGEDVSDLFIYSENSLIQGKIKEIMQRCNFTLKIK